MLIYCRIANWIIGCSNKDILYEPSSDCRLTILTFIVSIVCKFI